MTTLPGRRLAETVVGRRCICHSAKRLRPAVRVQTGTWSHSDYAGTENNFVSRSNSRLRPLDFVDQPRPTEQTLANATGGTRIRAWHKLGPRPTRQLSSLKEASSTSSDLFDASLFSPTSGTNLDMEPASRRALLFPGQGSQHVGMGADLFAAHAVARETLEEAESVLAEMEKSGDADSTRDAPNLYGVGPPLPRGGLTQLMQEGPQGELTRTENAQPAIMTVSIATLRVIMKQFGIQRIGDAIGWATGHSLGEYSALVAAGALSFGDAIRLVRHRGLAMARAVHDTGVHGPMRTQMSALIVEPGMLSHVEGIIDCVEAALAEGGLREIEDSAYYGSQGDLVMGSESTARTHRAEAIAGLTDSERQRASAHMVDEDAPLPYQYESVQIANINSSTQVVLVGTGYAVNLASTILREEGIAYRALELPVSAPFHHSRFMKTVYERMKQVVAGVKFDLRGGYEKTGLRVICNLTSAAYPLDSSGPQNQMITHLFPQDLHPINWHRTLETLQSELRVQELICPGPGRALAALARKEAALKSSSSPSSPSAASGQEKESVGTFSHRSRYASFGALHSSAMNSGTVMIRSVCTDADLRRQSTELSALLSRL